MLIPQKLAQFKNKKALLLVSGKQEMFVYSIEGEEIRQEKHIKVEKPTYSDNEGHFKVRSRGSVVRSGNVRELDDRQTIVEFKNEIKNNLKTMSTDVEDVYITAPAKTKNEIIEILPQEMGKKVVKTVVGNYCAMGPLEVLQKFVSEKKPKKLIKNPEARKILKKSNKARKVIKGKPD